MKTVSLGSSRTTGARKKGKKKKKSSGQKKPGVGGVSRADLERFGIIPVGGKKKSSKKKSNGKKSSGKKRGRKKAARTTGSRQNNRGLTKQVKKQLNKLGISVGGRRGTTGMMAPNGGNRGFVGNVMGAFGDLWGYGSGAVIANALGGGISQLTGQFMPKQETRLPWNKLLVSLIGAFLVSLPAFRRWSDKRGAETYWAKARRGMLGFFGFAAVYNLVRAGAGMADMNLDDPESIPEDLLSYVAGTNGMLGGMAVDGQLGQGVGGRRVVGGVTDLFGQTELVERLAAALDELQAKRDELSVALDGLYGDVSDEQLAVYTAASDYVAAVDNRINLAQQETDLDVATEIVLDGMNMAAIAQGMLAGLTAGITAPEQQMQMQQQQAPAQQAAQQMMQQAQQQAAQAQQYQQAAQQQAAQAQQFQQLGQQAQAVQAGQQAQQLQQAAVAAQAQAQQAAQTAQAYQQQAYAQQQAMAYPQQQAAPPMQPPAYGAPTAGGYYPFESGPAGAGAVGGVMQMPDGSSLQLNQTFTTSGRDGGTYEVDAPNARQLLTTVGTTSGIDANRLAQWAAHLSTVSGGNLAGRDLMKAWLQSNAGAAGTNPGGQVGSRVYGNTTGARATSLEGIPLAVNGRVVMCPATVAGVTRTVDGILTEIGMA